MWSTTWPERATSWPLPSSICGPAAGARRRSPSCGSRRRPARCPGAGCARRAAHQSQPSSRSGPEGAGDADHPSPAAAARGGARHYGSQRDDALHRLHLRPHTGGSSGFIGEPARHRPRSPSGIGAFPDIFMNTTLKLWSRRLRAIMAISSAACPVQPQADAAGPPVQQRQLARDWSCSDRRGRREAELRRAAGGPPRSSSATGAHQRAEVNPRPWVGVDQVTATGLATRLIATP